MRATELSDVKAALMVVNLKGERVAINDFFFYDLLAKMKAITSRNKIDNNGSKHPYMQMAKLLHWPRISKSAHQFFNCRVN